MKIGHYIDHEGVPRDWGPNPEKNDVTKSRTLFWLKFWWTIVELHNILTSSLMNSRTRLYLPTNSVFRIILHDVDPQNNGFFVPSEQRVLHKISIEIVLWVKDVLKLIKQIHHFGLTGKIELTDVLSYLRDSSLSILVCARGVVGSLRT